jgi:hypothetical protein
VTSARYVPFAPNKIEDGLRHSKTWLNHWLGGVEPAGPMLTFQSMNLLRQETSSENLATLAIDLTGFEFAQSALPDG